MKDGPVETGWREALDALSTSRSCDGCDLCCTVMGVRELEKAPGLRCPYIAVHGGCSIWGSHPPTCKRFTCLWRQSDDILPPGLFPASCGYVLALDQTEAWPTHIKVAGEETAWDTSGNRDLFARLAASWNCAVVAMDRDGKGTAAFAPSGRIYSRAEHPKIFPLDGLAISVPDKDYDPDRRPPSQRIMEVGFCWWK